jgi:hypothetical protein
MKKELQEQLFKKYPKIFQQKDLSPKQTAMCWGIETGDGWYQLIDGLCHHLQFNTDHNNNKFIVKNRFYRVVLPLIDSVINAIPCPLNLETFNYKYPILAKIKYFLSRKYTRFYGKIEKIRVEGNEYPQVQAIQVKEKYGGLRFYATGCSREQHAAISFAESWSYNICEKCGSTKDVSQTEGWIRTLCMECLNSEQSQQS